jgi:tRNA-(ms[2]io[6]A)-hydroxylase
MLKLVVPTPPNWVLGAIEHFDEILLDHAHCEKKAAGAAVKLLFAYPQHPHLQEPLSRLAREELGHYEEVLRHLAERDIEFRRQRPSPYGGKLHALVRPREPDRLLDLLLVAALIEARSCERLKLLSDALEDEELARFYRGLLAAEARHHQLYFDLACQSHPLTEVRSRLSELSRRESEILGEPAPFVRLHT